MFLSKLSSKLDDSFCSGATKKSNKIYMKKLKSEKKLFNSKKEILNKNFKDIINEEIKNEIKNKIKRFSLAKDNKFNRRNSKRVITLSGKSGIKSFFKPKNKLKFKFGFRKSCFIPTLLKKEEDKDKDKDKDKGKDKENYKDNHKENDKVKVRSLLNTGINKNDKVKVRSLLNTGINKNENY